MSLPPEREIATLTDLLRATVRKAIQSLVEEGLIVQRRGSGSFDASDAPRIERSLSLLTSFSEDMKRRGMTSTSVWLERGIFMPSPDEGMALALAPDQSVSRIARLRRVDDKPMAIERASLSLGMLPNPLTVETSLYEVLAKSGLRRLRALQKISAINLGHANADLLEVDSGDAGLSIERTSYLGDNYNFVAELRFSQE